jgi:hypothetical protein
MSVAIWLSGLPRSLSNLAVRVASSLAMAARPRRLDPARLLDTSAWRPKTLARSTQVEHGRICMLTALGFITPEAMGDLPIFMSPWPCRFICDIPATTDELADLTGISVNICSLAYPAPFCRLAFVGMFFHDGFLQDAFAQWDFVADE